jgi:U3 small nucleolar RNA-associated protein 10
MPSALAAQLAQGASLNAAQLLSRSRKRKADSYLFSSREAEQHDLESIHALGVNGFTRLKAFVPSLAKFEDILFSDVARDVDRTLLPKDEILEYDRAIASVLRLLSPHILESPTGKVLEWLVRRFRCVFTSSSPFSF